MTRKRLAIVGCGSSGLISLKMAREFLPDWQVECYEKTNSIVGCWGRPYPGFVSTSTKFTTQFSCFPKFKAETDGNEFFCNGEYGEYLEEFADHFELRKFVSLECKVEQLKRVANKWQLQINGQTELFDAVVLCTGLAAQPKTVELSSGQASPLIRQLSVGELNAPEGLNHITNQKIVVVGGGESAVDYANRLAKPELNNEVLLSLKSGIRVSPRYHPVRGVPSDFLRNRLMLSINPGLRNWLGQVFVQLRIRYENQLRKLFPQVCKSNGGSGETSESEVEQARRREWTMRLTLAAKDDLFNMFHNKSDDFLEAVGKGRITIVGAPIDDTWSRFQPFADEFNTGQVTPVEFTPDLLVPAIGYQPTISGLSNGAVSPKEFYLGCCHVHHPELFLVGFARPIIGNIPTISEMQARLVCGMIAQRFRRPTHIRQLHSMESQTRDERYPMLNNEALHAVEMFPYCDKLATMMNLQPGPSFWRAPIAWWKTQTTPATTLHYFHSEQVDASHSPRYMPLTLVGLLLLLKPLDWIWRAVGYARGLRVKATMK